MPLISETSDMQKVKHVLCWAGAKPGIILNSSQKLLLLLGKVRRKKTPVLKIGCIFKLGYKRTNSGSKKSELFLQTQ